MTAPRIVSLSLGCGAGSLREPMRSRPVQGEESIYMKAPLLLVVDDDEAVLEALELELLPQFGGLCRIETFSHPQDVLQSLPRWQEEKRPIALAIVDQKMPGLTGVELLQRLRDPMAQSSDRTPESSGGRRQEEAFQPSSGVRTVLLTGYGGPGIEKVATEVANRYREKPWAGETLGADIRGLLADYWRSLTTGRRDVYEAIVKDDDLARLWKQLEVTGSAQAAHGRPAMNSEDLLDAALKRLLNLRTGEEAESPNIVASESFIACVLGVATADQRAEVRSAVLKSPALRRAFEQLLRDLSSLRQPDARQAFDSIVVPEWVRYLASQAREEK